MNDEQVTCIRCATASNKKNRYCLHCGAPLMNKCMNQGELLGEACGRVNPKDAVFCTKCGHYTAFHKAGLLTTQYEKNCCLEEDDFAEFEQLNKERAPYF